MAVVRSYQDIPWSPLATIPEVVPPNLTLPLTNGAIPDATHGRSGDLLVVQLKSSVNEKRRTRESLRSLGLKGVGSQSLRSSLDDNVYGYIQKARHLLAVIELDGVQWKSATKKSPASRMEYELIKYGNNTRPGGLYRNNDGDYFDFVSDRDGLQVNWSTALGASACLEIALASHVADVNDPTGRSIVVLDREGTLPAGTASTPGFDELIAGLQDGDSRVEIAGPGVTVEIPTPEAAQAISRAESHLAMVNIALQGVRLTWQKPRARFIDSELELAEVGLYYRRPDFDALRVFCRKTGAPNFFDNIDIEVQVRERGVAKRVKV